MLPEDYANVKDQVGPCGISCGECNLGNGTVAGAAIDLAKYLQQYDVASWAHEIPGGKDIDFKLFDQNLSWAGLSMKCPGCVKGGGNPECPIRLCSREKGFTSCGQCSDLKSCGKFDLFGERGIRLKTVLTKNP